jgi:hypothetical protein
VSHVITGDHDLWFAQLYMIYFWMVDAHYSDRVTRKLGRFQDIPPPAPESWIDHVRYRSHQHGKQSHVNRPYWNNITRTKIEVWYDYFFNYVSIIFLQ